MGVEYSYNIYRLLIVIIVVNHNEKQIVTNIYICFIIYVYINYFHLFFIVTMHDKKEENLCKMRTLRVKES